jgi:hypothetical protein
MGEFRPLSFDELLAPCDRNQFLGDLIGISAAHIVGAPNKFTGLISWNCINQMLMYGGLDFPRIRVFKDDVEIPSEKYLRTSISGFTRQSSVQLMNLLWDGAILAINSVDELHQGINSLCRNCESILEVPIHADIYSTLTGGAHAPLHWQDHDVLILQVEGSQTWRLYRPTLPFPTIETHPPVPGGDPAWLGVVEASDLLYIPRGWWYSVNVSDSPSLCLALRFRNPTAIDILQHLVEGLSANPILRMDYPRFAGPGNRALFLTLMQSEFIKACRTPGLIVAFLREKAMFAEPRSHFSLPSKSTTGFPTAPHNYIVRPIIRIPGKANLRDIGNSDRVEIPFEGEMVALQPDEVSVFECICREAAPIRVSILVEKLGSAMLRDRVLECLSRLIERGIIGLEQAVRT